MSQIEDELRYIHEQADDIRIQVDYIRAQSVIIQGQVNKILALIEKLVHPKIDLVANIPATIVGTQPAPTAPGPDSPASSTSEEC